MINIWILLGSGFFSSIGLKGLGTFPYFSCPKEARDFFLSSLGLRALGIFPYFSRPLGPASAPGILSWAQFSQSQVTHSSDFSLVQLAHSQLGFLARVFILSSVGSKISDALARIFSPYFSWLIFKRGFWLGNFFFVLIWFKGKRTGPK